MEQQQEACLIWTCCAPDTSDRRPFSLLSEILTHSEILMKVTWKFPWSNLGDTMDELIQRQMGRPDHCSVCLYYSFKPFSPQAFPFGPLLLSPGLLMWSDCSFISSCTCFNCSFSPLLRNKLIQSCWTLRMCMFGFFKVLTNKASFWQLQLIIWILTWNAVLFFIRIIKYKYPSSDVFFW